MKTKSIETKYNLGDKVFIKTIDGVKETIISYINVEEISELNSEPKNRVEIQYGTEDGKYFWEEDKKILVEKNKEKLEKLIKKHRKQQLEKEKKQIQTNINNHKNDIEYENKRLKQIEKEIEKLKG